MRQSGTVKFFNHSRGFGFITPDDGGKDVFLHISALQRAGLPAVDEGARISFETSPIAVAKAHRQPTCSSANNSSKRK